MLIMILINTKLLIIMNTITKDLKKLSFNMHLYETVKGNVI